MSLPQTGERSERRGAFAYRTQCPCYTIVVLFLDEEFPPCPKHGHVSYRQCPRVVRGSKLNQETGKPTPPPTEKTPLPRTPRPAARVATGNPRQAQTLAAVAKFEQARRDQLSRVSQDPWAFLTECVQTLDQASGQVRPFPTHLGLYLEPLVRLWEQEKLLLVVKSRRMFVTWLFVALHYWLARFRPATKIAFMARKEGRDDSEGSAELVKRAWFIHEHLPPGLGCAAEYKFCRLTIPETQGEIVGIGEGADQLRQHTVTAILADEFAFWPEAYETYVAARPTLEGGGRFVGVSTPGPGFFKSLVMDIA